jgi:hypothetical protein
MVRQSPPRNALFGKYTEILQNPAPAHEFFTSPDAFIGFRSDSSHYPPSPTEGPTIPTMPLAGGKNP